MALTCAMIKIKCLSPTGCQPSSIAPRGELPGPQIWATVYSFGWQPVFKLNSSLPGMRLNCAPRRFFHMKENNVFLCIKEMRGFSILLRSRQNHFKIFLFPSVLPLEESSCINRCLLSSSIALWANSRAHTFGPLFSSDNKHHCLIWVPHINADPCSVSLM